MVSSRTGRGRPPNVPVEVYGTNWCADTQKIRRYLDRQAVPYVYHNMEKDQAAARQVQWWTGGSLSHPTIQVAGQILVEPSLNELNLMLSRLGVI